MFFFISEIAVAANTISKYVGRVVKKMITRLNIDLDLVRAEEVVVIFVKC